MKTSSHPIDGATRSPGRPRDERADRLILEAALDLFLEVGYDSMSIERVAERAGVGKTTIYRRWPSKEELVVATIDTLYEGMELPDTGDVRVDLKSVVRHMHRLIRTTKAGRALPRMAGEVARGTALGHAYMKCVMAPRVGAVADALQRALERGELRPDLNVQLAVASLVGPMMFLVLTGRINNFGDDLADLLVDQAIDGMQSAPAANQ
jgi:AcrR family transcriptional regulator